jgi:putative membrane protein
MKSALPSPRKAQRITTQTATLPAQANSSPPQGTSSPPSDDDPIIPPINAYGTFDPHKLLSQSRVSSSSTNRGLRHSSSHASHLSSISTQSQHQPLLPSSHPANDNVMDKISSDLIPFASTISMLRRQFAPLPLEVLPPGVSVSLL